MCNVLTFNFSSGCGKKLNTAQSATFASAENWPVIVAKICLTRKQRRWYTPSAGSVQDSTTPNALAKLQGLFARFAKGERKKSVLGLLGM